MIHQKHSVFDKNVTQHGKIYKKCSPGLKCILKCNIEPIPAQSKKILKLHSLFIILVYSKLGVNMNARLNMYSVLRKGQNDGTKHDDAIKW